MNVTSIFVIGVMKTLAAVGTPGAENTKSQCVLTLFSDGKAHLLPPERFDNCPYFHKLIKKYDIEADPKKLAAKKIVIALNDCECLGIPPTTINDDNAFETIKNSCDVSFLDISNNIPYYAFLTFYIYTLSLSCENLGVTRRGLYDLCDYVEAVQQHFETPGFILDNLSHELFDAWTIENKIFTAFFHFEPINNYPWGFMKKIHEERIKENKNLKLTSEQKCSNEGSLKIKAMGPREIILQFLELISLMDEAVMKIKHGGNIKVPDMKLINRLKASENANSIRYGIRPIKLNVLDLSETILNENKLKEFNDLLESFKETLTELRLNVSCEINEETLKILGTLQNLKKLEIQGFNQSSNIFEMITTKMKKLVELTIQCEDLKKTDARKLGTMAKNMNKLELRGIKLHESIIDVLVQEFSAIEWLALSINGNSIEAPSYIRKLSKWEKLKTLEIAGGPVTVQFIKALIKYCPQLVNLNLKISKLEKNEYALFKGFTELRSLKLFGADQSVDFLKSLLSNCKSLKELELSLEPEKKNNKTDIEPEKINNSKMNSKLRKLKISALGLSVSMFSDLFSLIKGVSELHLIIPDFPIKAVPNIKDLRDLKILNLNSIILSNKNLKILLDNVPKDIKKLILEVETLNKNSWKSLSDLKDLCYLSLSGNPQKQVLLGDFLSKSINLIELHVALIKSSHKNGCLFGPNSNLTKLVLLGNKDYIEFVGNVFEENMILEEVVFQSSLQKDPTGRIVRTHSGEKALVFLFPHEEPVFVRNS